MINVIESSIQEVLESVRASSTGLTTDEAAARLAEFGPNDTPQQKIHLPFRRFLSYLSDGFSILLLFASLLLYVSGMMLISLVILGIVILNALASVVQELRAERTMDALKGWVPESTKVFRDGQLKRIMVQDIVPGDIISLAMGDRVPADARLMEASDIWVNNIPLTGEATPQSRSAHAAANHTVSYLEAPNLVFMSTSVVRGYGKAVVFTTGAHTKFGEIAGLTQKIQDPPSPLETEIAAAAKIDFILAMLLGSALLIVALVWLHLPLGTGILFMIGVMVSLVPEALQLTVSSALAISSLQMAQQNVLVKRLSAVQTLGSVTVICTDKTGTITKGEMTVRKLLAGNLLFDVSGLGYYPAGVFSHEGKVTTIGQYSALDKLITVSTLCNSAQIEPPRERDIAKGLTIIGDGLDGALVVAAMKFGLDIHAVRHKNELVQVIPFSPERNRMTTLHQSEGKLLVCMKGTPSAVFSACTRALAANGALEDFTLRFASRVEEAYRNLAHEGLRVIACAYRDLEAEVSPDDTDIEHDMVFVGLVAMYDPPRSDVKDAIRTARQAGIEVVVMTGDSELTTETIAAEVGITNRGDQHPVTGEDLRSFSDDEIAERVHEGSVLFARVSPTDKFRIVKSLMQSGEVVAVTGDGANDAPSLKQANIGVAMGASGTDIAKESADLVLLDDSFASIVMAVEAGRRIYNNIRRFIVYVFSHNWAQLITYFLYILLAIPLPLLVMQILAIDLFIDILPSLAISREAAEPGIMNERPRSVQEHLLNASVLLRSLYVGVITATGAMILCLSTWIAGGWSWGMALDPLNPVYIKGTTLTLAGIVFGQIANVLSCRTDKVSMFRTSINRNKWIVAAIMVQIIVLSLIVYVPWLQPIFGTTALDLLDWGLLFLVTVAVIIAEEARKTIIRFWKR
jgi:magnesium-transporting ATPase (P-type)